jgi:hypothetical protein
MSNVTPTFLLALSLGFSQVLYAQDQVKQIEKEGLERTAAGQLVQQEVDGLHQETRNLVDEYQSHLKLVEGLRMYNDMLQRQLENQDSEINLLQTSIGDVAIVERQILPLMSRMIDGLEQFVELDIPFLLVERRQRIEKLRGLLLRADVTVAEKTRRVLEAYQVENDYGRTIEAYKDKVAIAGGSFDADFLRIGRVALLYRLVGNEGVGYWDAVNGGWTDLESGAWRRYIEQGLKVARQEIAPELISVSLDPRLEIKR